MSLILKYVNSRRFPLLLVICLSFAVFSGVLSPRFAEAAPEKAQDFTLKGIDGKMYSLSSYKGKAVLLNFWATWCPACVEELPSLKDLSRKFQGSLQVLAVSIDGSEGTIRTFLKSRPLPFPVLEDPERKVAFDLYAVFGLPSTFLVDKQGNIADKFYGSQDWMSPKMVSRIEKLIK